MEFEKMKYEEEKVIEEKKPVEVTNEAVTNNIKKTPTPRVNPQITAPEVTTTPVPEAAPAPGPTTTATSVPIPAPQTVTEDPALKIEKCKISATASAQNDAHTAMSGYISSNAYTCESQNLVSATYMQSVNDNISRLNYFKQQLSIAQQYSQTSRAIEMQLEVTKANTATIQDQTYLLNLKTSCLQDLKDESDSMEQKMTENLYQSAYLKCLNE